MRKGATRSFGPDRVEINEKYRKKIFFPSKI
jgi:hypothetical protein